MYKVSNILHRNNKLMLDLSKFSFGATSAITSSLALLIGLNQLEVSQIGVIGALLVLGLADNIADSLGMHVYSESKSKAHTKLSTATNYLTRLAITLAIVVFVIFLPISYAIGAAVIIGMAVLAILSYFIAKDRGLNPGRSVTEHLAVAALVLIVSQLIGASIKSLLHS
jgi:CBS domain containing-hemolysin-like protein